MNDLTQKIKILSASLPTLPAPPLKNLFDITGTTNKEVVNSRVLAYFLDPSEDHGLKNLFFDSLKEVIHLTIKSKFKTDEYTGDFQLYLEEETSMVSDSNDNQKRIDLLIVGQDWNIIIENKLYHFVSNPLKTYWEHTTKKFNNPTKTLGVVLSLFPVKEKDLEFEFQSENLQYINILHSDLLEVVQRNFLLDKSIDLRSTFYLKEYVDTIESHYRYKIEEPMNNIVAAELASNHNDLNEILDKFSQASKFLDSEVEKVMSEMGYTKEKQWYGKEDNNKDTWFWFLSGADMIKQNRIWFCLEVWNNSSAFMRSDKGLEFINSLRQDYSSSNLSFGHDASYKHNFHIAKFNGESFFDNHTQFSEKLKGVLNEFFLEENAIVEKVNQFLSNHNLV